MSLMRLLLATLLTTACADAEPDESPFETTSASAGTGAAAHMSCSEIVYCLIEQMDPDTNACAKPYLEDEPEYENAEQALETCDESLDNGLAPAKYDDCLEAQCAG